MVIAFLYDAENINLQIHDNGTETYSPSHWYYNGTTVSGSVSSIAYKSKGSISGNKGSAIFTINVSGNWNGGTVAASTTETKEFNGTAYLEVGGTQYSWSYYYRTNTVTCSHGGKSATAKFRSPSYYSTNQSRPTSTASVSTWWGNAYKY